MQKNLKRLSVLPVLFAAVLLLASCHDRSIPPNLDFAKKVVVLLHDPANPDANSKGWLTCEVSGPERILELNELLTQNTNSDSGDCGFGDLRLVFADEEQSIMLAPALDGCPTMYVAYGISDSDFYGEIKYYYNEYYYSISAKSKERLNAVLAECFPTASQNWSWN